MCKWVRAWDSPLAVATRTDYGSSNFAASTLDFIERHDIEIYPAGKANAKGQKENPTPAGSRYYG